MEDSPDNNYEKKVNNEIHDAKVKAGLLAGVLSIFGPLGFIVPLYYYHKDPKDYVNSNAEDQEKELEKQKRLKNARIESSLLCSIPEVGIFVTLLTVFGENPDHPKSIFLKY